VSTMSIRLPDSLHRKLRDFARQDSVSINQFVTTAVAEKLAAFATLEYLENRGKRASEDAFAAALAQVPDVEADAQDR
jgi:hypothetical protein